MEISEVGIGIILCIQSYWDLRDKEIPVVVNIAGGIIGILLALWNERITQGMLWALVPGAVCLLLGKISREAIGYGDGILICVMGLFLSWKRVLSICMIALMLAGVAALILFVVFHKKGSYEMPLVPFLFVGFAVNCVL